MKTILAAILALTASTAYAGPPLNCPGNSCNAPGHNGPGHNAPGHNAPGHNAPGHNAPGHNAPGHNGPAPIEPVGPSINLTARGNVSVINRQHNVAPVVSVISGVTIRATAGRNSAARISGNSISATAVGNSSVIRIRRGQ